MRRRFLGLALVLFSAALGAPLEAQLPIAGATAVLGPERTHSLSGSVRLFSNETPAANVRVVLTVYPERMVAATLTAGNGYFEFEGLPDGQYELVVEDLNYGSVHQAIDIRADSIEDLRIYLRSGTSAQPTPAASIVTAQELSRPRKAQDAMREGLDLLYRKSDYRGSLGRFERAIQEDPTYYEAYAQMGVAQMCLKNFADSEVALRKAIELSKGKDGEAYLLLAGLFSRAERYADAEQFARQAAEIDSGRWQAHSELARALLELHRPEEAEASAATARRLQPQNESLRLLLADIHIALRNYAALRNDLESYLRLAPNGAMADQARKTLAQIEGASAEVHTSAPASAPPSPASEKTRN